MGGPIMSENNNDPNFSNLFGGVKFLSRMYASSTVLGAIFTALLLAFWIWYAVSKKKLQWKQAVKDAARSLHAVSGESISHNDNTNEGDEWET